MGWAIVLGIIVNYHHILLAQKATKQPQKIALLDVQRETGIAWSTLNSWVNNQITRYDAPAIMALCEYFDCQVGDLLVYEKEDNLHIAAKA